MLELRSFKNSVVPMPTIMPMMVARTTHFRILIKRIVGSSSLLNIAPEDILPEKTKSNILHQVLLTCNNFTGSLINSFCRCKTFL